MRHAAWPTSWLGGSALLLATALATAHCGHPATAGSGPTSQADAGDGHSGIGDTWNFDASIPSGDTSDAGASTDSEVGASSEVDGSDDDEGPCPACDVDAGAADGVGDLGAETQEGCEFPADPVPGTPGAPCSSVQDCDNGLCIPNGTSKICTTTCSGCCPSGFACELVASGSDSAFLCVPKLSMLCTPCNLDSECATSSSAGALCVSYGAGGSFCGGTCQQTADCPSGYACQAATGKGSSAKQCVRTSGECSCSAQAVASGATTTCVQQNAAGSCSGTRACSASGLSACDAALPSAETCNGKDDNCDGLTDPADAEGCTPWFVDQDGDLYGAGPSQCLCGPSGAYVVAQGGDCNDGSSAIAPGAFDGCNGVDDNCNGVTDEGYGDLDGDGSADCVDGDMDGDAYPNAEDCSPTNAAIHPGAKEVCNGLDDDCDGSADAAGSSGCSTWFADADKDGAGDNATPSACLCATTGAFTASAAGDCNDANSAIKPGATEVCDGADNDCNGLTDEGCDDDGDGWCDIGMAVVGQPTVCPYGAKDCNDSDAAQHPGQQETCANAKDDDCDGLTDSGEGALACTLLFSDADGDSYGAGAGSCLCAATGLFTATKGGDCDDASASVHPGASEVCGNAKDDDCNGLTDEAGGGGCSVWYADGDKDGFGAGDGACLCGADAEHPVSNHSDCDDGAVGVSPAASETCNGVDDNCNGSTDEGSAAGCAVWHADGDGDGFGAAGQVACLCAKSAAFPVSNGADCDDGANGIHPGAAETCNGIDDNCDGATDDPGAGGCQTFYADADGDTWGNGAQSQCLCGSKGIFTASKGGDCDDGSAAAYPGKAESCDGSDNNCDGSTDEAGASGCKILHIDHDGDSYGTNAVAAACLCAASGEYTASVGGDCNDNDMAVHPAAAEVCNGVDDDCDGSTDPAGAGGCSGWFVDQDGDGFGSYLQNSVCLCKGQAGYAAKPGDCNDGLAAVNPGATDVCNGIDDDCSGSADPKGAPGCKVYYADGDQDSYGVSNLFQCTCTADGAFTATLGGDCNDALTSVHPNATEVCNAVDDDCNGLTDDGLGTSLWYQDLDGDGYGAAPGVQRCGALGSYGVSVGGDCNDGSVAVSPAAAEQCNGIDDNCNAQTDEVGAAGCGTWYRDADGDGVGVASDSLCLCAKSGEYTAINTGDCNDASAAISPKATESCNGIDDNCDGYTDVLGSAGCTTYYIDGDGDGYGNPSAATQCACGALSGHATQGGDCNDADKDVHPTAAEVCNGKDDNCDGVLDPNDAAGCTIYFGDGDSDGYGVNLTQCACAPKGAFTALVGGDCNDQSSAVHPNATEICNGIDDNCNSSTDEGLTKSFWVDADGDGWGFGTPSVACAATTSYPASQGGDCDDAKFAVHPGATEVCNGIDDNCNSAVDDGLTFLTYYGDGDGDGFGKATVSKSACSPPLGYVLNATDCDDASAAIKPTAIEICNGIDDNCNSATDEGLLGTYYHDGDGDGYGNASATTTACSAPATYVGNATDCNDASTSVHPGATEITCDGIDQDCSGSDLCTCTPVLLQGFNASNSSVVVSGSGSNWTIGTGGFTPTEGAKCAYYGGTGGYYSSTSADTVTVTFTIPQNAPFLTVDYILDNALSSSGGIDNTLMATFTFNGQKLTVGPYATLQGTTVHQISWPVPANLWGTSQTLVIVPTANTNGYVLSGIMVDNLRTSCN